MSRDAPELVQLVSELRIAAVSKLKFDSFVIIYDTFSLIFLEHSTSSNEFPLYGRWSCKHLCVSRGIKYFMLILNMHQDPFWATPGLIHILSFFTVKSIGQNLHKSPHIQVFCPSQLNCKKKYILV
jgi:hypothetical protein